MMQKPRLNVFYVKVHVEMPCSLMSLRSDVCLTQKITERNKNIFHSPDLDEVFNSSVRPDKNLVARVGKYLASVMLQWCKQQGLNGLVDTAWRISKTLCRQNRAVKSNPTRTPYASST